MTATAQYEECAEMSVRHRQVLDAARRLDSVGRGAEHFLYQQLDQLSKAIEEFEREKSAWRRQVRRDTRQLELQRAELDRLRAQLPQSPTKQSTDGDSSRRRLQQMARRSGAAPIIVLLQPCSSSPAQTGLLLFELAKLNRELGGRGLTFDLVGVRYPRVGFFRRPDPTRQILEIRADSALPLRQRGSHVALDVDLTDRLEQWIAFKAQLLDSVLLNSELKLDFEKAKQFRNGPAQQAALHKAEMLLKEARPFGFDKSGYAAGPAFVSTPMDAAAQQFDRLECCVERLNTSSGLRLHIALND